jgi:hypothetical protein
MLCGGLWVAVGSTHGHFSLPRLDKYEQATGFVGSLWRTAYTRPQVNTVLSEHAPLIVARTGFRMRSAG